MSDLPENKPLQGVRLLVTRARDQAAALAKPLQELGGLVMVLPMIEIRPPQSFQPLDKALHKLPAYDWLILTSVNGVKALLRRMEKMEVGVSMVNRLQIAAIGPATKAACEENGIKVSIVPPEYVAESVVDALKDKVAGQRVLLVRAKVARDVIPVQLRGFGAEVDVAEAYETVVPEKAFKKLKDLLHDPAERPQVITFTSSSTAKNFVSVLEKGISLKQLLSGIQLASIGPVTSATLREVGLWVDVEAAEYTIPGLIEAITRLMAQTALKE